MKIQVTLSNADHPEYGVVTVPFPIPKTEYENVVGLLEQLGIGSPSLSDCRVDSIHGISPVLQQLTAETVNVDELDYLVKRLDGFDEYEITQFQGMAHLLQLQKVPDLINLTFCCQQTTVITDFSDLERVGKRHYLTIMGTCTTDELQEVDGVETACLLIDSNEGKVTPFGVIYDNGMRLKQVYDGKRFPVYSYNAPKMELKVSDINDLTYPVYLDLPMPREQIDRLLLRSGVEDYSIEVTSNDCPTCVMEIVKGSGSGIHVLNDLCTALSALNSREENMLESVIDYMRPEYPEQVTHLIRNLDQFDFVPDVRNAEEYGRYLIQQSGRFQYDEHLDEYYNYESYGRDKMRRENGIFVIGGYVSYHGTLSLDELMMEDPVEEHQREQGFQMGGMS